MQYRYQDFERPLISLDENHRMIGFSFNGVYCGWDTLQLVSGNDIDIIHTATGIKKTLNPIDTESASMGLVVTRQGVLIYEDAGQRFSVDFNVGEPNQRIDIVVADHEHVLVAGGADAVYSLVKGGTSGVEPAIPNPKRQTRIGRFIIPAGATDHDSTIWIRDIPMALGGHHVFGKLNRTDVREIQNSVLVNDFNKLLDSQILALNNNPANSPGGSNNWTCLIVKQGARITQLAINANNGKSYSRASSNTGSSWGSWVSLNNPDIATDIDALETAIGTRIYTEQNYVTNGESLTSSIDALDQQLQNTQTDADSAAAEANANTGKIGNQTYSQENYVTNGESLTSSIDALDQQLKIVSDKADQSETDINSLGGLLKTIQIPIGSWDMDTDSVKAISTGLSATESAQAIFKVVIRSDTNTAWYNVRGTDLYIDSITAGAVALVRANGGAFDNVSFSSIAFSRGWVFVTFNED